MADIFQYGGNTKDAQTGVLTPVAPTINSSVLQPSSPISYNSPDPVPVPAVSALDTTPTPPLVATPQEGKASVLSTDIQTLNETDAGKAAFRTQQEADAGIPDLVKTQTDLGTQIKQLQNEALAIPQQLQIDATGRGITSGGLAPLQTARLRTNAIAALGASSLLDASKGFLASAQDKVDRAVAAKYDPIEAEIKAKTANLDLILKDPATTLADKNRAQAQLDIQTKKAADLAKNKEDTATIMSWAAAALANGATALQAQQIQKLAQGDKPDLNAAFALYAPFAKDPNATAKALLDLEQQRANIAKTKADTTKAIADANGTSGDSVSSSAGTISGDVKDILEGRNTMFNIRQTMGRTNKAAAYMQQVRDEIRKVDPNFDFVASDAGGKSVSTPYVQKATSAINAVLPNIDKIVQLSNDVGRIGVKGVDGLIQSAKLQVGDKNVSSLREAQKLIADEIGVALGAGTVSDMKLQLGFDVTDTSVKPEIFASNMKLVQDFLENRKKGLESLRYKSATTDAGGAAGTPGAVGKVLMTGPDGVDYNVPSDQVDAFVKAGGKKK